MLKIVFGIAAGFVLDVPLRRILPKGLYGGYEGHADEVDCHEEHEEHSSIFLAALRHTLEIFVFILVFSFIIGLIFGFVGADSAAAFLGSLGIFQPMMAALIGLVPNCGASVLLAQLYMGGAITFGSFFCGAVLRRRYRPGCAVACQPQLETEPVHDRAALVLRHLLRYFAAMGGVRAAGGHNP